MLFFLAVKRASRSHFITARKGKMSKPTNNKCLRGCEEKEPLFSVGCNKLSSLWKSLWRILQELKMNLSSIWTSYTISWHMPKELNILGHAYVLSFAYCFGFTIVIKGKTANCTSIDGWISKCGNINYELLSRYKEKWNLDICK